MVACGPSACFASSRPALLAGPEGHVRRMGAERVLQLPRAVHHDHALVLDPLHHQKRGDEHQRRHQEREDQGHDDERLLADDLDVLPLEHRQRLAHTATSAGRRSSAPAPTRSMKISSSDGAAISNRLTLTLATRGRQDRLRVGVLTEPQLGGVRVHPRGGDSGQRGQEGAVPLEGEVHRVGAERGPHLLDLARQHRPALVDEDDLVHELLRFAHHVGREQDRPPFGLQLLQDRADEDDVDGIESRHRLVEDHDLGVVEHGADELHLLLVPLGELLELAGALVPEVEALEPRLGAHPGHGGPLPLDLRQEQELVEDAHLPVQAALLGEVADPIAHRGRVLGAQQLDDSGVGQEDPVDHAQRRGLPRAVAAEQARDRAARDGERQPVHGADLAEGLGHLSHPENGVSTHAWPPQKNLRSDPQWRRSLQRVRSE